jgi:hypothetical protein
METFKPPCPFAEFRRLKQSRKVETIAEIKMPENPAIRTGPDKLASTVDRIRAGKKAAMVSRRRGCVRT